MVETSINPWTKSDFVGTHLVSSTDRGTSLALIYVGKLNIIKKKYEKKRR